VINVAGSSFDFGQVLFAVLQECEHKRRGLVEAEAREGLQKVAREKLAEIRRSYDECGGTASYWATLEREVLETTLPAYMEAAVEQNRRERTSYGLWRQGDPAARAAFALIGLVVGGILVALPFVPIWEDLFAFALALAGFLYPDLKKAYFDIRHSRLLNGLVAQADRYQKDRRIHYLSQGDLDGALDTLARTPGAAARQEAMPNRPFAQESAAEPVSREPQGDRPS
jgi:hypothetical protein